MKLHDSGKLPNYSHPFKCDECRFQFPKRIDLINHKESHNDVEKPFPCEACDKTFKTAYAAKEHLYSVHYGMKRKSIRGFLTEKEIEKIVGPLRK